MENIIKQLSKLKGIEYNSKEKFFEAIENILQDIQLKDYSTNYNFITLELNDYNKVNIVFDTDNYKIIKLEVTINEEIIF